MDENPYRSPQSQDSIQPATAKSKSAFTLVELAMILGIMVVLIALLLPAVRHSSEAQRRSVCSANLHQIGRALQAYEQTYHELPPAYTVDDQGRPLHSWRTLILPYLDCTSVYESIDLDKPWDEPDNQEAFKAAHGVDYIYQCPSSGVALGDSVYLAVVTAESCLRAARSPSLADVKDDPSQTILVIEVDREHAVPWMAPVDADEELWMNIGPKSGHPLGGNVLFAELNVHFIFQNLPPDQRRAMVSIAGGDDATTDVP